MIGPLEEEQIEKILCRNVLGHLGCHDEYDSYVYPVNFVYDGKSIICHSQPGSKIDVMRLNKRICLQVDEIKDFANWVSVMVLGQYQEITEEWERYQAIKIFVDHHLQLKISNPSLLPGLKEQNERLHVQPEKRPIIYRIIIDKKNGRYEDE